MLAEVVLIIRAAVGAAPGNGGRAQGERQQQYDKKACFAHDDILLFRENSLPVL